MLQNSVQVAPLSADPDYTLKLLFLGEQCVGKTSLLNALCGHSFDSESPATIGIDFHSLSATIQSANPGPGGAPPKRYKLQMWDCAGQMRFRAIVSSYYRHAHVIVIVYDVTSRISFHRVAEWKKSLDECLSSSGAQPGYITFLMGNKTDCRDSQREVTFIEGEDLAVDLGFSRFFEVSARTANNLHPAFRSILSDAHDAVVSGQITAMPVNQHLDLRGSSSDDAPPGGGCLPGRCSIS